MQPSNRQRIWGWFFFDWASQPYNTLLITFIFGPYVAELIGDGVKAQAIWGWGIGATGVAIAILAPILGAMADTGGNRLRWIWGFSGLYVLGSAMLWCAAPGNFDLYRTLFFFAIGMIGMEFATIFTNAMLPELAPRDEIGRISGNGWAFGYLGGLITLALMLALFAEDGETGRTMLGHAPVLGLDGAAREGTRAVGPLTAIWYALFMIPFFLWVRDPRPAKPRPGAVRAALRGVWSTIKGLPRTPSLFTYLASSMFYRDALNGMYVFGGIYATGVLGWGTVDVGIFGIIAIITGALFAWLGGRWDVALGPKPVIAGAIVTLTAVAVAAVTVSRGGALGIAVGPDSNLPDIVFYVLGSLIGAAGGVLQAASRTMMVRQANPERMTEAFGLYALSGKATSFIAPLAIGAVTALSGSQQIGVTPLIALFLLGLILLRWVHPEGDPAPCANTP